MSNLGVNIGKLKLKNPVMVASGTFGYAEEFKDFIDLKKLGAIVTKTITLKPHLGNPPPRTCESPSGLINSIGLENPGIDIFLKEKWPFLEKLGVPIIVSISSLNNPEEFIFLVKRLDKIKKLAAIELNISCPNLGSQFSVFGSRFIQKPKLIAQDPKATYNLIKRLRKFTQKTLIAKLSPNVTDITEVAAAAKEAGTDCISLVNTFLALAIDVKTQRPKIATVTGGLSGPAIRPIALRMVYEVYQKVKIPIIGMGGIIDTFSALEFFIAGASSIAVGTANLINPEITIEIIEGLKEYLKKNKIKSIKDLIGTLKV